MAKASNRILDVWIAESQSVYTEVPFAVVVDWIQQGRLLPDDRVRLAGKETWHPIQKVPALAPYLPQAEPLETAAASESLEPVDMGLNWKKPDDGEDDDVDMIPLIDISLVLLIFFMMTATVSSGVLSPIRTPETKFPAAVPSQDQFWIGIDPIGPKDKKTKGGIWYSLGHETNELIPPTTNLKEFQAALLQQFGPSRGEIKIRIRADRNLPIQTVRGMIQEIRQLQSRINNDRPAAGQVNLVLMGEVSEGQ